MTGARGSFIIRHRQRQSLAVEVTGADRDCIRQWRPQAADVNFMNFDSESRSYSCIVNVQILCPGRVRVFISPIKSGSGPVSNFLLHAVA